MKQYSGPVMNQVRENIRAYFSTDAAFDAFYNIVFNVDTAKGFGLDIWGRIVAQERFIRIETEEEYFGFDEADNDWYPFNDGVFFDGTGATTNYRLSDDAYRLLIKMKAFANLAQTNIPSMNYMLMQLFGSQGRVYVQDLGNMAINIVFDSQPSVFQKGVLNSGVFPHPGGVHVTFQYMNPDDFFGFFGSGFQPLNQAPFFNQTKQEIDR